MSQEMFSLKGKAAVVTGGASGMGEAITRRFLQAGASVLIVDIGDQADKAAELGAEFARADVSDPDQIAAALDIAIQKFGKLDILVNNAGIAMQRDLQDIEPERAKRIFEINALGVIYGMAAASTRLTAGGAIVNTASLSSTNGSARMVEYSATKGAVVAATRSAAMELGPKNIRVNAINPGVIKTPMSSGATTGISQAASTITALERIGAPEEVAAAAHFLASDDARYVTGHTLVVDGGWSAGTTAHQYK